MCGIVGLHLRSPELEPVLGSLLTDMLVAMTDRGPDSAGIAIYENGESNAEFRYSLQSGDGVRDWVRLADQLADRVGTGVHARRISDAAVLSTNAPPDALLPALGELAAGINVFSQGRAVEVFKDVGTPEEICNRYEIRSRAGYQGLGHTRMATESAVTTEHSHPFSPADDICLVHNGSFSNYATVRRDLMDAGAVFDTDNDSEVAARLIARELAKGRGLGEALEQLMDDLDGFFTLLVATAKEFAVVRDPFACKPAVIAETDDYIAFGSEYRALAGLPGIAQADVFEPGPEELFVWSR
jgi:glutamate synthase domain-containing protein 1